MTNNLLDTFLGRVTPDLFGRMASTTGAPDAAVSRMLGAAVPLLLAGVLQQANDAAAMSQIMRLLNSPAAANGLGNLGRLFSSGQARSPLMDMGADFLSLIFGERQGAVAAALSQHAGTTTTSASSLLSYAAPIVLAVLGNRVRKQGLSAMGVTSLIARQREIFSGLPTALLDAAGLGSLRDAGDIGSAAATRAATQTGRSMRWLVPTVIGGVLILAVLWALLRPLTVEEVSAPQAPRPQVAADAPRAGVREIAPAAPGRLDATVQVAAEAGAYLARRLPNDVEINVPARGVENQVILLIEDPARQIEPAVWFNFDRVAFETGAAILRPESEEQLRNVAEILKAYPTVEVRIGGYTDNTGNPQANLTLAQDRAAAVMNELVRLGVAPHRLAAEVSLDPHPVADDSAEAGRARNRRIALRVAQR